MAAFDHRVECAGDPVAVLFRDRQCRQQLDGMAGVAGDLTEDLVILEQRNGDQLAEQALARRLQHAPRRLQRQRFRRPELDADDQTLAANVLEQFITRNHRGQRRKKLGAARGSVLDQLLILQHVERRDARRHREIVLRESRPVHDGTVHPVENLVEDCLAQQYGSDRDMTAGQRLRQQHHIRFDVPMLDSEETTRAAHPRLDLVGDEQRTVALAQCRGSGEIILVGHVDALALDGLDDEGRNLAGHQRLFKRGKVTERNGRTVGQQRPESIPEILVAGQRQRTIGHAAIGVIAIDDAGPAGCSARELDRSFDTFRP